MPKFFFSPVYRVLFILALLVALVVLIFPLLFKPQVELPTDVRLESPLSVKLEIGNQNFTPLTGVEYTCEVSELTLANGFEVTNAKVLNRGTVRRIRGRQAVTAHCEAAYFVNLPVKTAEYTLTLKYSNYPWRQRRTSVYRIAAQLDGKGQLTGWKLE